MRLSKSKALKWARSGRRLYRVWGYPMGNIHEHRELNLSVSVQMFSGKQKFSARGEVNEYRLNGSAGNIWFTKLKEAESYKREILDGHHPIVEAVLRDHSHQCDMMDESLGICDRGLGGYEDSYDQGW